MKLHKNSQKPHVIFSYTTEHLLQKDKVRFYYALKGRAGNAGIIRAYKVEQLGKTVLLVPASTATNVENFLKYWKCVYTAREVSA